MEWPPNFTKIYSERQRRYLEMRANPALIIGAKEYYKTRPANFISDWCVTYDPRNASKGLPTTMPFQLFPRQREFVQFLYECYKDGENGLVEKSRDMGATWVCCGFSVWLFLFTDGAAVGWGSRKEMLVDKLGDPDSIFEKIRIILQYLPSWFLPENWDEKIYSSKLKLINPDIGNTITGESGDNIGRGGRKSIYLKDESAHYERPQKIEAALGDNTDVQIDFSSVNGTGNIFHNRRLSGEEWEPGISIGPGITRVFIMDWSDHPAKDQDWYDKRKAKAEREGLTHLFAQEVDRDYAAAVEGVVIPAQWVRAAVDAHVKLGFEPEGKKIGGFDVADEGGDKHALSALHGVVVIHSSHWAGEDGGEASGRCIVQCKRLGITSLQFDNIGVGATAKAETNRLRKKGGLPKHLVVTGWNAASGCLYPNKRVIEDDKESPLNKDFYKNLKTQGWWKLRIRFEKTYRMVNGLGIYPFDELISIPKDLPGRLSLENELSQATYGPDGSGRIMINKKPEGTKSPNKADSLVMAAWPVLKPDTLGTVGAPASAGGTTKFQKEGN